MKKVSYLPESVKFDLTALTQKQLSLFTFITDKKEQKKSAAFKLDHFNDSLLSDLAENISVSYVKRTQNVLENGEIEVFDELVTGEPLQYVDIKTKVMVLTEFTIPFLKDEVVHFAMPDWFNRCNEKPSLFNVIDSDKCDTTFLEFLNEMLNEFSLKGNKFSEKTLIVSTFS